MAVMLTAVAGQVTVRPVVGLTTEVRLMLPAKLNVLVRLMDIAAPVAPELKFTGLPTLIVKSPTWTIEDAWCVIVPGNGVPVTVTRYVPAVEELRVHKADAVPLAVRLVGVAGHVTVKPEDGLTTEVKVTVPAKF